MTVRPLSRQRKGRSANRSSMAPQRELRQAPSSARDAIRAVSSPEGARSVDPVVSLLADMHSTLGNATMGGSGYSPEFSADLGLAAVQQHAAGSLALAAAGFESGLGASGASNSAMRAVMRRSQAEAEGLDTAEASKHIGKRGGQPLPEVVRVRMERAFDHDFSSVRIHLDGAAADTAATLNAVAFAVGKDIYFGRGAWAPGTQAGDELLAHELTHVVQADENRLPGPKGPGMDVSSPNDRHEQEAVAMGRQVAQSLSRSGSGALDVAGPDLAPVAPTAEGLELPGAAEPEVGDQNSVDDANFDALFGGLSAEGSGSAGGADSGLVSRDFGSWWSGMFGGGGGSATNTTRASSTAGPASNTAGRGQTATSGPRPQGPGSSSEQSPDTTITLAGRRIRVAKPAGAEGQTAIAVDVNQTITPGVTIQSVSLQLNETGAIVSGTARASVTVGTAIQADGITLTIGEGGRIQPSVDNVAVKLGESIEARVSLQLGAEGITGSGTISFDQLPLPAVLGINAGALQVNVDADGVRAAGTLTGAIANIGTVAAETGFREGQLGARVTVTATPGFAPVPDVVINSGELRGSWLQGDPSVALAGDIDLGVKQWLQGVVHAELAPDTALWTISGELTQSAELTIADIAVLNGRVQLRVADNVLTEAAATLHMQTEKVQGTLTGTYDIPKHELSGTAAVSLNQDLPMDVTWGNFTLKQGGALSAEVAANKITSLTGNTPFSATVLGPAEAPILLDGTLSGALDVETNMVDGTATATLAADLTLPAGEGGDQLKVLTGSAVRATIAQNALTQVQMDLELQHLRAGELFLTGKVVNAIYNVEAGTLSGVGKLRLEADIEHTSADGLWKTVVLKGSELDVTVADSAITRLGGSGNFVVHDLEGPLLDGTVSNAEIKLEEEEVSGTLEMKTARSFFHPRQTGGEVEGTPGWMLEVQRGSGVSGTIAANELTQLEADLMAKVSDGEGHLLDLRAKTDWDVTNDVVNGTGAATLARDVLLAEGMGEESWTATALKGAVATGHLEDNQFTKITGELDVGIDDAEGRFVDLHGGATWLMDGNVLDMTSTATVVREKQLAQRGAYSLALQTESSVTGVVEKNDLTTLDGTLKNHINKDGEAFAKADLVGAWKKGEGVTGEGSAELLVEQDVAESGDYHLWLEKGTGATVNVEKSDLKSIGGKVPMRLDEQGQRFIKGEVSGTYMMTEKKLSGTGEAEVLVEKQLGTLGQDQLWLMPGTGATVTLADNALTEVGGNIQLSARDGEGEYATLSIEGTFDAAGGTGFTGTGAATVVREKQLYASDNYTFLIMPGTGATAHIEKNELKKLDGQVPFEVRDSEGPLFGGKVSGDYNPETGLVNGGGDIRLGRDLTYNLGGGVELKLLTGSGGDATVVDSELRQIGGTLTAELIKDGQPQARITADGTYNAVTNVLETLTGEAELLRPMSMLGGALVLTDVSGNGTIRDNQLVQLGGSGTITVPSLNNMTGTFNVNWSNESGRDVYEGDGELDFTLFDDPAKGRSMTGKVTVAYHADDTFEGTGQVTYAMNELVKDVTVGVAIDQTLDPVLNIDTTIEGDLVDARTLFSLERDLVPKTSVPIWGPFGLFFGMKGGMSMGLRALEMSAGLHVQDWRPISERSEVPTFSADLQLDWGMDFSAKIAPYIGLEGNLAVASLGAGVKGEVALEAPVSVTPSGKLEGGPQGFRGELGVGVSIKPRLDLSLTPFLSASITGLDPWEHEFAEIQQPLGEVFSFEWGGKYTFGDQSSRTAHPTTEVPAPPAQQRRTETTGVPSTGFNNNAGQASNKKGGPQLESGSQIAGQQQTGDAQLDQMMAIIEDIKVMAEGVGALGELVGLVIGLITATATFGPIGLIVYCVWKIFKGELSWDRIKTAVQKVVEALQTAGRLLRPYLPDWFNGIVDLFSGDKPGLLDALFGADDRMRESVRKGEHRHAPAEMRAEMIKTMSGGWVSEDDEECILEIIRFSASHGDLRSVVSQAGGAERLLGDVDGREDSEMRNIFRRGGIAFDD